MTDRSLNIRNDQLHRVRAEEDVANNPTLTLCSRCEGTGNEFYSMYRACSACEGLGTVTRTKKGSNDD